MYIYTPESSKNEWTRSDPKESDIGIPKDDDDDVYLDKLQTRGIKKNLSSANVKRRPANKA
jgi:hypothetical protein